MSEGLNTDFVQLIMDLRGKGITEARILNAIEKTPREMFVDPSLQARAYEDRPLEIGYNQTISQPFVVGLMTHALKVGDRMRVLEVGTGSGYQAAILARLAMRVYTVERIRPLLKMAEQRFKSLTLSNVTTRHCDGFDGWPEQAPFDRIIVTASLRELPDRLIDQLQVGGILVCPVGPPESTQVLLRITKQDGGKEVENLGFVAFVPMVPGVARDS